MVIWYGEVYGVGERDGYFFFLGFEGKEVCFIVEVGGDGGVMVS